MGLGDAGKKKAGHFSLGMRQRRGIAIALAGDPDFLVLDEPVNGLDPQGIIEMRELILQLNRKRQITVLISSHIPDELSRLATHYGFIDGGRMVKEMTAQELEAACRKCVHMITVVISSKAVSAVVSVLLAFGFLMAALICLSVVEAPEFRQISSYNEVTGNLETTWEPNPEYPGEKERKIYQTLLDLNPAGQMYQLAGRTAPDRKALPVYACGLVAAFNAAGIVLFQRKDIK